MMGMDEIVQSNPEFLYRLLSRMQADCAYYLGNGGHNPRHLWALDEHKHIETMRNIYHYLCKINGIPDWISKAEIDAYAEQILVV